MHIRLDGEVAAVTGGGGILCGAMARALAAAGARVAVLDLREEAAAKVCDAIRAEHDAIRAEHDAIKAEHDAIRAEGGKAIAVACDVLSRESMSRAAARIEEELGAPTILVNGAGGNKKEATTSPDLEFFDIPLDAVRGVFDLNFIGTLLPCQVLGRRMAEAKRGSIVNISSLNSIRPLTRIPAYSAAKAAVSNFTQWLAVHMARNYSPDIRVNAIAPGFFLTDQNRFLLQDEKGELTARGRQIIDHTPQARFGDPADLTGTLLWLVSPGASFVSGIVVTVDGGFSAYSGV